MRELARGVSVVALSTNDRGELPTEVRLLTKGWNRTTKGDLYFDDKAAADLMAQWREYGNDLMIDLNHDSWDENACAMRADAQDALGWWRPEIRDGELWMCSITWTPEGADRLRSKKQRYISPVLPYDKKTMRVTGVWNAALVAYPATHHAQPLVAASARQHNDRAKLNIAMLALAVACAARVKGHTNGSRTPKKGT